MIIAVGFKVNYDRAVQFRKWANRIVKDYTIKGWVMDDERLKNGGMIYPAFTPGSRYKSCKSQIRHHPPVRLAKSG